ncbi:MAG: hypothetical protein KDA69_01280 [Planctomycetaceae bacterium]|nr:hypothetical protein [Planctomycetaceae bacterium]MCA9042918.1 hypothetical protein [Planctomycetaceae bacterium]
MKMYDWKRFWCPRDASYGIDEDGFLFDPEGENRAVVHPYVRPLSTFARFPCLVMLGEPGIGKSTEFATEFGRLANQEESDGSFLHLDLKDYQTDARLVADAFDCRTTQEWINGRHTLTLSFDSLDEGKLEIRTIANLIASQLRRLSGSIDRLRLRIACRTAEWPRSLELTLRDLWTEQSLSVIELLPLRKTDVASTAVAEGIEASSFIEQIIRNGVQPFATLPVTLGFLIRAFQRSGEIPSSKYEVYESGCKVLCEETNQSRQDSNHDGNLSGDQRLEIASRIAACTVFTGQSAIGTSIELPLDAMALSISDLSGDSESTRHRQFEVSEADIRETLNTALFTGRGPSSVGFAHRTFAEFLAARYVARSDMDDKQIESLIFHPDHETRIIPQLTETAAWIAVSNDSISELLICHDPQVLLRSDVAHSDNVTKERLIENIIRVFESDEFDDSDWALRMSYRKLDHAGLAGQLQPHILETSKSIVTRRFAIDLAEECGVKGLLEAMQKVALDKEDDVHIRSQAAHAVIKIGSDDEVRALMPLAVGEAGSDPDDELRGAALLGLWPKRLITAEQLFSTLRRRSRQSLAGSYYLFLRQEMPKHLLPDDLETALRWCSEQTIEWDDLDDFYAIMSTVVCRAINRLSEPNVLVALGDFVISRLQQYNGLPISDDEFRAISDDDRRKILHAVVLQISDLPTHVDTLIYSDRPICAEHDLEWLLDQSSVAETEDQKRRWALLARSLFFRTGFSCLDQILTSCASNSVMHQVFAAHLSPIRLDSEEATVLRTKHNEHLELLLRSQQLRERALISPSPEERVMRCLDDFDNGDLTGWWRLNRALQLEPRSERYEHDLEEDLTLLPGWESANDSVRRRCLLAAKAYLLEWKSSPRDWLSENKFHLPDMSGYRALVLVQDSESNFLDFMSMERWANVTPAILGFPTNVLIGDGQSMQARRLRQTQLAAVAYVHSPETVIHFLIQLIDRENSDDSRQHLEILSSVDQCWDDRLRNALSAKLEHGTLRPPLAGILLSKLIQHGSADAIAHARLIIESRSDEQSVLLARKYAVAIWQNLDNCDWGFLWPIFQSDRQFFGQVMVEVAHDHRMARQPPASLSEPKLAECYVLLAKEFPHETDPVHDGVHEYGPREHVQEYREGILSVLVNRGTDASCTAIEWICNQLPNVKHLCWTLRAARRNMLSGTWNPLSVQQFRELAERPTNRLVRNARELQHVLLESLARLQERLHGETPAVRDLWDKLNNTTWRPVDENAFSDYLKRHLELDLKQSGIVALREVEIRRGNAESGEKTDIYVVATIAATKPDELIRLQTIIEVKGCWHDEVKTAMETQLRNRYLKDNLCDDGIYVVGWFACDSWDSRDRRRRQTPKWALADAREFFFRQSQTLSDDSTSISSFVFDTSLR